MAERLVNGLADENTRWGNNVAQFRIDALTITGDTLLASAFVSYIGPFSARIRNQLWQETWLPDIVEKKIPYTEGVDPLKVLATDADEAHWKNNGLPADRMSLENAGIITSCSRWPLIIDPQLQGSVWIRQKEGESLEILQLTQDRWLKKLQNAIQLGKVLLIENVQQDIDATLDPVLQRATIKKGRGIYMKLGADEVEYDPNFRLFLMSKLSNPHYRPEIAAQCTIINFKVTESGLEDQLLANVVDKEKPELEAVKTELVRTQNEFKVTLARLEDELLNKLVQADLNTILENTPLIEGLEQTKKTSEEIKIQTIEAQENEVRINVAREVYRRVAAEGAMLYFLIISLCNINALYQYSLESFKQFYFKAMDGTEQFEDAEQRVLTLRENIRLTIYRWISRGLFEAHKLIFLSQITLRLMQKGILPDSPYEPELVNFLLKCPTRTDIEKPQSLNDWLPDTAWFAIQKLIDIEAFSQFGQQLEKDAPTRFKDWFSNLSPETTQLPLDWKQLADHSFKKLVILRCMRPDRLAIAMTIFIRHTLPNGDSFCDMDQGFGFERVLDQTIQQDSTNVTPIFFILSPGCAPVGDTEKVGKPLGYETGKNFFSVALGQGQDKEAMRLLENGHKEGHWVMLENIHLMPTWLPTLEKTLDAFAAEGSNYNFRLFLSAEPGVQFPIPVGILERSIKLTNEPPSGLKANMLRAFDFFGKEDIDDKDNKLKSIMFGLCFFHSVVVERKKFGSKGWNGHYPFNLGDLRDSVCVLNNYLENNQGSSKIPWDDLKYIFGEIMYGGHITDDPDRVLCMTYLDILMEDKLLLDDSDLFPFVDPKKDQTFKTPPPATKERYMEHIEQTMPAESPIAFGLHPNAEIGFRTTEALELFNTLLELQPKDASAEEEGEAKGQIEIAQDIVSYILEDMNIEGLGFDIDNIRSPEQADDEKLCYINVFLQECEYMNALLKTITRSLQEISLALRGELTATEEMEKIIDNLVMERIPMPWSKLAYPSSRGLSSWLTNLIARYEQLNAWKDEPSTMPKIVNIARLFNPQSYLTAIKQYTAQRMQWELNKLYIVTDVTKRTEAEITDAAKDGAYVTGINLDGARWDVANNCLEDCKGQEMFSVMPIIQCRAQMMQPEGKEEKGIYQCPCYRTIARGATFIFTAQLKTPKHPPAKWVLAGVAIILDVEGYGEPAKK